MKLDQCKDKIKIRLIVENLENKKVENSKHHSLSYHKKDNPRNTFMYFLSSPFAVCRLFTWQ